MEASQSSDSLFPDTVQTPTVSMDTTDSKSARIPSTQPSESKQKQDLFGNDDLFSDANVSLSKSSGAIPKTTPQPEKMLTPPADKDVKSAISEKVESKEPVTKSSPKEEEDDLFSSSKIGSTKPESKRPKKKVLPDIDDDIFSSAAKSTFKKPEKADVSEDLLASSSKPKKASPAVSAVPMFEQPPMDDDDDIFASGTKKTKSAIAQVLDDDDDDDIFAGISVAKGKTTAPTTTKTTAPERVVDDDDIFADASINKPKGIDIGLSFKVDTAQIVQAVS